MQSSGKGHTVMIRFGTVTAPTSERTLSSPMGYFTAISSPDDYKRAIVAAMYVSLRLSLRCSCYSFAIFLNMSS